jgi:5-methylcytosine-specific restriction enzyme A
VTLKLSNFLATHPNRLDKGMESFSKLDEAFFKEFVDDKQRLHALPTEIKKIVSNQTLKEKIYKIEDDEQSLKDSVMEGQVIYQLH